MLEKEYNVIELNKTVSRYNNNNNNNNNNNKVERGQSRTQKRIVRIGILAEHRLLLLLLLL